VVCRQDLASGDVGASSFYVLLTGLFLRVSKFLKDVNRKNKTSEPPPDRCVTNYFDSFNKFLTWRALSRDTQWQFGSH
jgi:hypothetical protein